LLKTKVALEKATGNILINMQSFFAKLYKYRHTDLRHQKENYLTEILAHCLREDEAFRTEFLKLIGYDEVVTDFDCDTQTSFTNYGVPDVFMRVNATVPIIIECKIDSIPEKTQLDRYAELLQKLNKSQNILVLLTKNPEESKPTNVSQVFRHLRWREVHELTKNSINMITKELRHYLADEKMSIISGFEEKEMNAIRDYLNAKAKMDDFLAVAKEVLEKLSDKMVKWSKTIDNLYYGIHVDLKDGICWIGFTNYDDNDEMMVCLAVDKVPINVKNLKKYGLLEKRSGWDFYDDDDEENRTWHCSRKLTSFFNEGKFNAKAALEYLESEMNGIASLIK
jgi:hypothetical protein